MLIKFLEFLLYCILIILTTKLLQITIELKLFAYLIIVSFWFITIYFLIMGKLKKDLRIQSKENIKKVANHNNV